jgi:hypothetical protein
MDNFKDQEEEIDYLTDELRSCENTIYVLNYEKQILEKTITDLESRSFIIESLSDRLKYEKLKVIFDNYTITDIDNLLTNPQK